MCTLCSQTHAFNSLKSFCMRHFYKNKKIDSMQPNNINRMNWPSVSPQNISVLFVIWVIWTFGMFHMCFVQFCTLNIYCLCSPYTVGDNPIFIVLKQFVFCHHRYNISLLSYKNKMLFLFRFRCFLKISVDRIWSIELKSVIASAHWIAV